MPVLSRPLVARRNSRSAQNAVRSTAEAFHGKAPTLFRAEPDGSLRQPCPVPVQCHTRFGPQPDGPGPQSQSLSRSYGSNLPTSLTYINLSTRDSKPWRPAADSVQAVESLRAPVFDFQGPRREYRHSNLIPCSTSLSNHISL